MNLSKLLDIGSVWIELIFAETENTVAKYFFKYVNSTVGPIFNKKIVKSGICGFVNSAQMHCSHEKVHIYGCTVTEDRKSVV